MALFVLSFSAMAEQPFTEFELQLKKAQCNDAIIDRLEMMHDTAYSTIEEYRQTAVTDTVMENAFNDNQVVSLLSGHTEVRNSSHGKANHRTCFTDYENIEKLGLFNRKALDESCTALSDSFPVTTLPNAREGIGVEKQGEEGDFTPAVRISTTRVEYYSYLEKRSNFNFVFDFGGEYFRFFSHWR